MANADISLLFGVLGEGSLSGESGNLIQGQLSEIMASLNKNPLKVKVGLDTESGGKRSWNDQLQTKLNAISTSGKFAIQISNLKIGAGAISEFKNQLNAVISTLSLDKGTTVTVSAENIGEIKKEFKEASSATDEAIRKLAEYNIRLKALGAQETRISGSLTGLGKTATSESELQTVNELSARYQKLAVDIEAVHLSKDKDGDYLAKLEAEAAAIQKEIDAIIAKKKAVDDSTAASARNSKEAEQRIGNLKRLDSLLSQVTQAQQKWTAAKQGKSSASYENLSRIASDLSNLRSELEKGTISADEFNKRFSRISGSFTTVSGEIKNAGENTKTFSERLGGLASKFANWLTVSQVIMLAFRAAKQMVTAVSELDAAMTELKKVTDETDAAYSKFLENASVRAKKLGATISDTVNASADFARLGYSLDDSATLADAALVYKNVGDGIEDIGDASESIISTLKAFNIEVSDSMLVVDKFNEVGNNFAISSKGVGDALMRSASALAFANNTLDESIALITAGNTVVQDADKVGTALKTVSMFLRAAKTEAEEAGENTDGMASSVSELRNELLSLTGGKVDIQIDEDSFKSTYQILKELSAVWGELKDVSQANILEMIGGKRNANVVSSIISNFEVAEKVIESTANAAGSALAENDKYLASIAGRVSLFKAAFEDLSQTAIDSDTVKVVIDFGTGLLNILDSVFGVIDALGGLKTVLLAVGAALFIANGGLIAHNLQLKITAALTAVIKFFSNLRLGLINLIKTIPSAIAAWKAYAAGTISASAAMQLSIPVIGLVLAVLTALVGGISLYNKKADEMRQKSIDAADTSATLCGEISSLTNQYLELSEAVKTDESAKEQLLSTQEELINKLGIEKSRIEELTKEYGSYTDAIKAASVEKLQDEERSLLGGITGYAEELIDAAAEYSLADKSMNHIIASWTKETAEQNQQALDALVKAGYISSGSYGSMGAELFLPTDGFDLSTVDGIISAYERLGRMMDIVRSNGGYETEVWKALSAEYSRVTDALSKYENAIGGLNANLAEQYMLQGLIGKEVPTSKDGFDDYRQSVIDAAVASGEFVGSTDDIESAVDGILSSQSQFVGFYENSAAAMAGAGDAATIFGAKLSDLATTIQKLQSNYNLLETAEQEMLDGGISVETIDALAKATENYLDFLYEENGVIKLNTAAWREYANSQIEADIAAAKSNIAALEEENIALQKNADYYNEQRSMGSDGGIWNQLYEEATRKIDANTAAIATNQARLGLYNALYSNVTGNVDAYTSALDNFTKVASTIDSVTNSFSTLASLQQEVANGFTLSLDKALEFASVYPEILNSATVTADGQIALNEVAVNAFIAGKRAELNAQIDAEISKLESNKAVLQARLAFAQAQLDLAKNVGEGEGQISKEVAEYRINAGNAIANAMITNGMDEATAYQLAAAAMSQNIQEFSRIAAQVCTDVDGNFNQAAYDMAMAMYNNAGSAQSSIASIAAQAHQTAAAIAAMTSGVIAGSSSPVGGRSGGTSSGGITYNSTPGGFKGSDYTYTPQTVSLDDYVSKLEIDISNYTSAISQIDGQIAALEALRNTPLEDFISPGTGSGSGSGGSSSGNGEDATSDIESAEKAVEEYIAAIDKYYEALKNLAKVQARRESLEKKLEHTDDLSEKIFISSGLVGVYAEEAEAEQALMDAKRATILANVGALRALGFEVKYNSDTNELFIKNLEHLNEITASSVGEYESLQEATNALRQDTEELISTTEELNDDNLEAAGTIEDLGYQVQETKNSIVDYIEEIYDKQVEAYQKIIDLRKELIESAKDEYDYESEIADKVKEIADLQARIDQLSLDDSRGAAAERTSLIQELQDRQKELADTQGEHSVSEQTNALDKMGSDFEASKEIEIEILRRTVNTSEELWNAFYQTILGQSVSVGDSINQEIANAWIRAANAVTEYGAAVNELSNTGTVIGTIQRYHDGGIVSDSNIGKDEVLAILQRGEIVLNDDKQEGLYRIIDFQEELSKRLGSAIGAIQPPVSSAGVSGIVGSIAKDIVGGSQNMVFEPHIEVTIQHNGSMSSTDVINYGEQLANITIDRLYSAFERRGMNSTRGARLKP